MPNQGIDIQHPKLRGERAELRFMARAAEHGLCIAKPWGDMAREPRGPDSLIAYRVDAPYPAAADASLDRFIEQFPICVGLGSATERLFVQGMSGRESAFLISTIRFESFSLEHLARGTHDIYFNPRPKRIAQPEANPIP